MMMSLEEEKEAAMHSILPLSCVLILGIVSVLVVMYVVRLELTFKRKKDTVI